MMVHYTISVIAIYWKFLNPNVWHRIFRSSTLSKIERKATGNFDISIKFKKILPEHYLYGEKEISKKYWPCIIT